MPDTLHKLLVRARRGNQAAARSFWNQTSPGMHALATSVLRDRDAADDTIQQVFCRLISMPRHQIDQIEDLRAYIAKAIRNDALNHNRSEARRSTRDQSARPVNAHSFASRDHALAQAMDELPDQHREVILLRHNALMTFDQIAFALDINRNTVASRYRAALLSLKSQLKDHPVQSADTPPATEVSHAR